MIQWKLALAIAYLIVVDGLNAQWVQTHGLYGESINCFAVSDNGHNLFAGTQSDGIFLTNDGGASWATIDSGLTNTNVTAVLASGANVFAGTYGGGIFLSTNNGTSWTAVNNGLTDYYVHALTGDYLNRFVATAGAVLHSTNNGSYWTAINTGSLITALGLSYPRLMAGADGGFGFFLSDYDGANWHSSNGVDGILSHYHISAIVVQLDNVFVCGPGGVFRSTDHGLSWSSINSGLTNLWINCLAVYGSYLFAGSGGTGRGGFYFGDVFVSTDEGENWSQIDSGLPNTPINSIIVYDGYLFAGTQYNGVWMRPLSEIITGVNEKVDIPDRFSLSQNYPNPFNPTTTISFRLPSKSFVSLKIFDPLGREVTTIVSEEMPAGSYTRTWNAATMPSGIYFYCLRAGGFSETKKIVLQK